MVSNFPIPAGGRQKKSPDGLPAFRDGFTIIEMVIVMSLIVIISVTMIVKFYNLAEIAKINVLRNNTVSLANSMRLYSVNYSKDEWYGNWNANGDGSLNNFVEQFLETMSNGHYSNNSNYVNPYSENSAILDYTTTIGSGDGYRPAVFLTSNSNFAYNTETPSNHAGNLIGTIVCYFHVQGGTTQYIDIYYFDGDGNKSPERRGL